MGSGPSKIELAEEELRVAKLEIEKLKQEEEERLDKERAKAAGEARVKQLVETAKSMVEEEKRRKEVEAFIRAVLEEEVETLLDRLAAEEGKLGFLIPVHESPVYSTSEDFSLLDELYCDV